MDGRDLIELQSEVSFLVSVVGDGGVDVENISFMPFSVKLLFDQLDNLLLFSFDSSLFLSESIEFCLFFCYFFAICVHVLQSAVWIFVPDVKNRDEDVSSEVEESIDCVDGQFSLVVAVFFVVERTWRVSKNLPSFALLFWHFFEETLDLILFQYFLSSFVELFSLVGQAILDCVMLVRVSFFLQRIIKGVKVISALESV